MPYQSQPYRRERELKCMQFRDPLYWGHSEDEAKTAKTRGQDKTWTSWNSKAKQQENASSFNPGPKTDQKVQSDRPSRFTVSDGVLFVVNLITLFMCLHILWQEGIDFGLFSANHDGQNSFLTRIARAWARLEAKAQRGP